MADCDSGDTGSGNSVLRRPLVSYGVHDMVSSASSLFSKVSCRLPPILLLKCNRHRGRFGIASIDSAVVPGDLSVIDHRPWGTCRYPSQAHTCRAVGLP